MRFESLWKGLVLFATASVALLAGCSPQVGDRLHRTGEEIVAAGQLFHVGTPVVLWIDPGGYDAYRGHRHFEPSEYFPKNPVSPGNPNRYGTRGNLSPELQARVDQEGWTLENLQEHVDQFVYHYDVCVTSRRCFEVLHDLRGLSVQFMLDLDGTIYQTLDLKERAWHAGTANDRCVGVEIANIGAYGNMETLDKWYALDDSGWPFAIFPDWVKETGIRTPDFVARPARKGIFKEVINGREVMMYDYTEEQYQALIKLTAALHRIFPRMTLDCPRNPDGSIRWHVFEKEEQAAFSGFMGHLHESKGKVDPGPAFDWERVLAGARRELGV